MEKTRIDKWLWAVRIFKTRNLASVACIGGKVKIKGDTVKPSHLIAADEVVTVQKEFVRYTYKVKNIIEKRVSAQIAATCLEDMTPPDEIIQRDEILKSSFYRPRGLGRPTKKERRELDRLKGR